MRKNRGSASHNEFSITAKPHFASSCGVGRSCRTSSLCHASAIRRSSVGTSIGCCASVRPIASYFITSVRLSTSVGCAVSTSSICKRGDRGVESGIVRQLDRESGLRGDLVLLLGDVGEIQELIERARDIGDRIRRNRFEQQRSERPTLHWSCLEPP